MKNSKLHPTCLYLFFGLLLFTACNNDYKQAFTPPSQLVKLDDEGYYNATENPIQLDKMDVEVSIDHQVRNATRKDSETDLDDMRNTDTIGQEVRPYPLAPGCSSLDCTTAFLREFVLNNVQFPRMAAENEFIGTFNIKIRVLKDGCIAPDFEIRENENTPRILHNEIDRICQLLVTYTSGKWSPMISTYNPQTKEPIYNPRELSFRITFKNRDVSAYFEGLGNRLVIDKPVIDRSTVGKFNGEIRIKITIDNAGKVKEGDIKIKFKDFYALDDGYSPVMSRSRMIKNLKKAVTQFQFIEGIEQQVTIIYYPSFNYKMRIL
ncbi:MAG: hypothetical protein AAF990_01525 [Bacteroidota bacterium]